MKRIILMLLLLILPSVAYSLQANETQVYYSFDDDDITGINPNDLTPNGNDGTGFNDIVTGLDGVIDQAFQYDGAGDRAATPLVMPSWQSKTINIWANGSAATSDFEWIWADGGDADTSLRYNSDDTVESRIRGGTKVVAGVSRDGDFHMYTVVIGTTTHEFYIDGVSQGTGSIGATSTNGSITIGSTGVGGFGLEGRTDEFAVFTKALNSSEVLELYNNGTGLQYPFTPPAPARMIYFQNISANNINFTNNSEWNTSVLNFNTFVNGTNVTDTVNINQSYNFNNQGFIQFTTNNATGNFSLTNLSDGNYNITIRAVNNETNATETFYFDVDSSVPQLNVSFPTEWNAYTGFNISRYVNFSGGVCNINISGGPAADCNMTNYNFTFNGNSTIDVVVSEPSGNNNQSLGNVVLVNPPQRFNFVDLNNVSIQNFTFGGTSFNQFAEFDSYGENLTLGLNQLTFQKVGYLTQSFAFNLTNTSDLNLTFNVSPAEIVVTIRDKETTQIVSGQFFQLEFIGSVGLITNTTTGTKSVNETFFTAQDYELRVTTPNSTYAAESVFFTFNNQESLPVTVYVVESNATNAGFVTVKVVDNFGQAIAGATAKALQWDSNSSSYIPVSQGITDDTGESILNIILDSKQYVFEASTSSLNGNSSAQFIPTLLNGKEIIITLTTGRTEESYSFSNVQRNITESYNTSTNVSSISFRWITDEGTDLEGCIKYYRVVSQSGLVFLNESCSTGSDVTLLNLAFINSSFNVLVDVGFVQNGKFYSEETFNYYSTISIQSFLADTNLSYYILPVLYMVAILVGMANIFIGGIMIVIMSGLANYLIPTIVTGPVMAFLIFLGLALMALAARRPGGNT